MPLDLIQLRSKPHLSISAVRTFLTCPRKYELQYRERVQPDYYPAALALGAIWHAAVARWLGEPEVDESTLDAVLRDDLRDRLRRTELPVLFGERLRAGAGMVCRR